MIPSQKRPGTAELLFKSAHKMGLRPAWITANGSFVVTTSKGELYVNLQRSLNSHVSSSLAHNKYLTRAILDRHNFPNIPFMVPKTKNQAAEFLTQHGTIIVKPLLGGGSRGIHIVNSKSKLAALDITDCILERYIPGKEIRYLVLNGSVIAVHESKYGNSVDEHRYLERISYKPASWDPKLVKMSVDMNKVLGLDFSAVDYIIDAKGQTFVLELNSRPGLKWFHAPSKGPAVDVAKLFLEAVVRNN